MHAGWAQCMNSKHCTHTNPTKRALRVCTAPLSVLSLTLSAEMFPPSIGSIRACELGGAEGTCLPTGKASHQHSGGVWSHSQSSLWLQPPSRFTYFVRFWINHSKISDPTAFLGLVHCLCLSITRSSDHMNCYGSAVSLPRMRGWDPWPGPIWM